jgi:hypothetical protein
MPAAPATATALLGARVPFHGWVFHDAGCSFGRLGGFGGGVIGIIVVEDGLEALSVGSFEFAPAWLVRLCVGMVVLMPRQTGPVGTIEGVVGVHRLNRFIDIAIALLE